MLAIAETLLEEMKNHLQDLPTEKDPILRSKKMVEDITIYLWRLKQLIKEQGFISPEDEITFYKFLKPQFHALYIYHATILSIEGDKPIGSRKVRRRYFNGEQKRIDNFFYHHLELYKYYKSGLTHLDTQYFMRQQDFTGIVADIVDPVIDREFCTLHSVKIAFLLAYEQVRDYLQKTMWELDTPIAPAIRSERDTLAWTESKVGLIELIYAFQAAGVFNNGKASIRQIKEVLEEAFHIELGNTSRTLQEILSRKKGYANFIKRLMDRFLERIEREDL